MEALPKTGELLVFMNKYFSILFFLFSAIIAQGAWREALPGWKYEFPADHGSHPEFKTEWWYFTGNLRAEDDSELGYQLTFFRQGVIPPERKLPASQLLQRDVNFAHFAVSDISKGQFYHFQELSRGAFGQAGFDDGSRLAWIKDWACERTGIHSFRLRASEGGLKINLELESPRKPVIHGHDGVSQKSSGEGRASHYYSLTRMNTKGSVDIHGKTYLVNGLTWFDHEWATNQLAENQSGWDWFSIQFQDGSDLMLFQIRMKEGGRDPYSAGTFVDATGKSTKVSHSEFELVPLEWWTSPDSKARYPVAWKVSIPKLSLDCTVRARFPRQELAADPFSYWEGAVMVSGKRDGCPVSGKGYLEMTGYAGRIVGMQAK